MSLLALEAGDWRFSAVHKNDDLFTDYVGKLETVDKDFKNICEMNNMPFNNMEHLGATRNLQEDDTRRYRKYFNDNTKNLIGDRYQKDINLFGYNY